MTDSAYSPGTPAASTVPATTAEGATDAPATVAAVDLGSNSFHLIVAQFAGSRLMVVDRMKDMVRLAAGLDDDSMLVPEVSQRALECLARFGQRLAEIPPENVRVVGTNTLRRARNGGDFITRGRQALGHDIEIISGREEARLIYLGVSHSLEDNWDRRLVVDIGGGSTEVIIGRQFHPERMESLYMGCVGMSREFFGSGTITAGAMKAAELAARQELEPIEASFRDRGWDSAIGASGTILAIHDVIIAAGWSREAITADALKMLRTRIIEAGSVDKLDLPGLPKQRAAVFPGGVAILSALFKSLGVERMQVSSGALREGLLWDLLGRRYQADVRERTINDLSSRYHVDLDHALRVQDTALDVLAGVADAWGLDAAESGPLMRWAAQLHEIGMDIAHSQYHKHGSYLLQNMDMPGFSRTEQRRLALLVRAHRRKFPSAEFTASGLDDIESLRRMALLLRCAVVLHRSRSPNSTPPIAGIQADDAGLNLIFPRHWLRNHPLTRLDLAEESDLWKGLGVALTFGDADQMAPPPQLGASLGN
ncbi:MAG TPA: exopolyphosphatase [Pseudomonadales bacterium]|nr:exopolyphosphatase [Pseudomonadales bacterium]